MAISSYSELVSNIKDWLWNRDDLDARIPTFIRLAEAQMQRVLETREMEDVVQLQVEDGGAFLPKDFAGVIAVRQAVREREEIKPVPLSQLVARYEGDGRPIEYAISEDRILFWPGSGFEVLLHYRKRLPPLSDAVSCNWLLKNHPDAYLYGALTQASPYLKENNDGAVWATFFQTAIGAINEDGIRQRHGQGVQLSVNGNVI